MPGDRTPRILGVNTRTYPVEGPGGAPMRPGYTVRVVLVEGGIGDYAAFVGAGAPEWVARHGSKVSFDEACVHFPGGQLDRERYRE